MVGAKHVHGGVEVQRGAVPPLTLRPGGACEQGVARHGSGTL